LCSAAARWRSATTRQQFERFVAEAFIAADGQPVLIDRFLEDATEVDVDAIATAKRCVVIMGVMEHIEEAGVHSGDSACAIPLQLPALSAEIREATAQAGQATESRRD
jgi:carbamoyl-phosphate synthase large subunit